MITIEGLLKALRDVILGSLLLIIPLVLILFCDAYPIIFGPIIVFLVITIGGAIIWRIIRETRDTYG